VSLPGGEAVIAVTNPATGEVIAELPGADVGVDRTFREPLGGAVSGTR
jgi:hypothetical protein